jgi:hypothetical protein
MLLSETSKKENSIEKDSIEFLEQEDHTSNSIEIPVVAQEQTLKQNELTYHCTVEGCTFHFFTHASLKKHVENYANKSNIRVSNTNMNFLLNKVKNNYTATTDQKKRYLTRLMDNMRFPPMFSENIKRNTYKNRKIIRKKGNTTKSRLSK